MLKRTVVLLIMVVVLGTVGGSVYAEPRVIAQVNTMTDHSAEVVLKWSDEDTTTGIMVTGWQFIDASTLVINFSSGEDVPAGFHKRLISHDTYTFPLRVHLEASVSHTPEFIDIDNDDPGRSAILNLYYRGIISGYPDGTFKPENNVTRAEFAKMLLLTAAYTLDEDTISTFTDVDNAFWAKSYIMSLASKGILKGKGMGTFDPNGQIKIGEVLTVLTRTFDLYEGGNTYPYDLEAHWSNAYFITAVEDGLVVKTDGFYSDYNAELPATREQCMELLSRIIEHMHDVTQ